MLLQFEKMPLAQFAPPEIAQRTRPEKRKPHLLFQIRLDRRRYFSTRARRALQKLLDPGKIRQIEELKKSVNAPRSVAARRHVSLRVFHAQPTRRHARQPFHFRPIRARLARDKNIRLVSQNRSKALDHSRRPAEHLKAQACVRLVQPTGEPDPAWHRIDLRNRK